MSSVMVKWVENMLIISLIMIPTIWFTFLSAKVEVNSMFEAQLPHLGNLLINIK